jgi:hypothetical protein
MNTRTALSQELPDGTVRPGRRQELHLSLAERERDNIRAIHHLGVVRLESENVPVEGQSCLDVRHGDANMGNAGAVRH